MRQSMLCKTSIWLDFSLRKAGHRTIPVGHCGEIDQYRVISVSAAIQSAKSTRTPTWIIQAQDVMAHIGLTVSISKLVITEKFGVQTTADRKKTATAWKRAFVWAAICRLKVTWLGNGLAALTMATATTRGRRRQRGLQQRRQ